LFQRLSLPPLTNIPEKKHHFFKHAKDDNEEHALSDVQCCYIVLSTSQIPLDLLTMQDAIMANQGLSLGFTHKPHVRISHPGGDMPASGVGG